MKNPQQLKSILDSMSQISPILVIGDVGLDKYTIGEVRRISPEAPVPVLEVREEQLKLGLAANVSHNLHALQVKSTLCGVVGEDRRANQLEGLLEEKKISTWGIVRCPERMTTYKERVTTYVQQICRIDYETSQELSTQTLSKLQERVLSLADQHAALIIEDYAKGTLNEQTCQVAIKKYREQKKWVTVDPSRSTPPEWYKGASLLKPNLSEAKLMVTALGYPKVSEENVSEMCRILLDKLSLDHVVITLGPKGMAYLSQGQKEASVIPTLAREVYDVSGAGDTVIAVITSALVAGADLANAVWLGNLAAGIVVGKKGTATTSATEMLKVAQSFYAL
jgi:rfaE bifunctional protein kinase chain/domain